MIIRSELKKYQIIGYFILLLINVVEARSGLTLTALQLILGITFVSTRIFPLLFRNKPNNLIRGIEIFYLGSIFLGIYFNWHSSPNHLFLFFILTILFVFEKNNEMIKKNLLWVLILIMGFATIHKLLNPHFVNGEFVGFMLSKGSFFRPLWHSGLFPETKSLLSQNLNNLNDFVLRDPSLNETVTFQIGSLPFHILKMQFTYFILVAEFLLTFFLMAFPQKKITYLFILIFIASIGIVVSEVEFASTLLFIGLMLCPSDFSVLKKVYKSVFLLYACCALFYNLYWVL
ncbi:hypothetical protein DX873_18655 [Flagellimonas nanhaiensis]|uniref:Uncharacterized protein n=1 Tax=Flagellimonas nanhaiensis TaxID=2292706 RepID=A0A371JKU7_9FLAO|nr:hypothetical protein DX873_18655 [Allomuricauda nanhaiensis]